MIARARVAIRAAPTDPSIRSTVVNRIAHRALALVAVIGVAACSNERISVAPATTDSDREALLAASTALATAGHTPAAFATFRTQVLALRPGFDDTEAEEAELLVARHALLTASRVPDAALGAPALITTVWPIGLAPPIAAPTPGRPPVDAWARWLPHDGESDGDYLIRMCDGPLALTCRDRVPEGLPAIVAAEAISRLSARARHAVVTCPTCTGPLWAEMVSGWQALDRTATANMARVRPRANPHRWPAAGDGAVDPPPGPVLAIEPDGDLELDGAPIDPDDLPDTLRATRRTWRRAPLAIHLAPTATVERLRLVAAWATSAGFTTIAIQARLPAYPYQLRTYLLPVAAKLPARDSDPIQVLLRTLDHRAR